MFAMTPNEIEDIIKECVDDGHTQGIVIGIIDESGTKFYKYGQIAVNDSTPIDENVIFETGSITKIFTSLLLTQMAQAGEVNLDDPIQKFLPENVRIPTYNGKHITLDHLSTHTAGFPYVPENFTMADMYNPFCDYKVEYLYDYLNEFKLENEPGTKYTYSNICKGLLGHVLSLRANKEYEDLVIERLFKPLGMDSTTVNLTDEMKNRFATAHIRDKIVPHWDIAVFDGAGSIHSTPKDLARFIEANLGFYKTDLDPVLEASMQSRCHQDIPYLDVGHEWNISYKYQPEILYHGGATGGHQVFIGFCPERKIGVVICSNSCAWVYDIGKNILNKGWYLKRFRQQAIIIPMMLAKFVGEYENIEDGSNCYIKMDSQGHLSTLLLKWGYYPAIPLYPSSEKDFFMKVRNVQISFDLNEQDDQIVDLMTVNYDGTIYKFRKK